MHLHTRVGLVEEGRIGGTKRGVFEDARHFTRPGIGNHSVAFGVPQGDALADLRGVESPRHDLQSTLPGGAKAAVGARLGERSAQIRVGIRRERCEKIVDPRGVVLPYLLALTLLITHCIIARFPKL